MVWVGGGVVRVLAESFVVAGPSGVSVRTRLKHLTPGDVEVLRQVGAHLGSLVLADLKRRCADGAAYSAESWAVRKRALTPLSSSRWAGSITKASHDQWGLARRGQHAHIQNLQAGVATIEQRLSLPIGAKGSKRTPGGYGSKRTVPSRRGCRPGAFTCDNWD
ncbi:hypothetical protein SRB5_03300 [Streptomyces sp. RB5]|uniref:Transposase n=1 Tax=Streptomyces smaragdinus TaxID=2585196 RepID=A0A7K0CA07_9ACTN|nr:hypothetical protein [Streptomyces smaragdinus]